MDDKELREFYDTLVENFGLRKTNELIFEVKKISYHYLKIDNVLLTLKTWNNL